MGCRVWGRTESDTTEVTQQQQHFQIRSHALMFQVAMNGEDFLKPSMPTLRVDSWKGRSLSSNPKASSWRFAPVLRCPTASRGAPGASAGKEVQGGLGRRPPRVDGRGWSEPWWEIRRDGVGMRVHEPRLLHREPAAKPFPLSPPGDHPITPSALAPSCLSPGAVSPWNRCQSLCTFSSLTISLILLGA